MRIGIICAMEEELSSIVEILGLAPTLIAGSILSIYNAPYKNYELGLVLSGIGKVNAALTTQHLIDKFTPELIINVGVAGGLIAELTFGDVVVATDLVHHDMDVTKFGMPLGQVPRMENFSFPVAEELIRIVELIPLQEEFKVLRGRIVSGDQFIDDIERCNLIQQTFNAVACEMEGAAIAHVCHVNKVPVLVVRSLSDKAGNDGLEATISYVKLKEIAALRASSVVKHVLDNYYPSTV
jgi:adenosylhomocysteine nucleosidase